MANRTGVKTYSDSPKGWLRERILSLPKKIDSTAIDAGNTGQTHCLRAGMVMGELTSGGNLVHYQPGASDGSETAVGNLMHDIDLRDGKPEDSSADHWGDLLVKGHVDSSECLLWDSAAAADLAGNIYPS